MSTATVEQRLTEIWETPKTLWGQLSSVDHKEIGKRYLVTALSCSSSASPSTDQSAISGDSRMSARPVHAVWQWTCGQPNREFVMADGHPLAITVIMWGLIALAAILWKGTLEEHAPIDVGGGQGWIANDDAYLEAWVTHAQSLKPGALMPNLAAFNGPSTARSCHISSPAEVVITF
jgi:hypothetical protein